MHSEDSSLPIVYDKVFYLHKFTRISHSLFRFEGRLEFLARSVNLLTMTLRGARMNTSRFDAHLNCCR